LSAIYRKGEVLGWGTVANVLKGWDELLDRPVAIKELVPPFGGSEAFVRAYFPVALRMVDISHQHVLATYSVEPHRFPPALSRELADETLAHQLLEGPIPPAEVLRLLRQVLVGLEAVHARDLVHLSIRPENLFVCGGVYKVGDFGIIPVAGAPGMPLRQFKYWAPELLADEPQVTPRADIYSLGVVAYELLLGSVRFERLLEETLERSGSVGDNNDLDEAFRWLAFQRSDAVLPPIHEIDPAVPVALAHVLEKMLYKEPVHRSSSCREVLAALGAAGLGETPAGTQALTTSGRVARPSAQLSFWMGGGIVVALALAGVALVLGLRDGNRRAEDILLTPLDPAVERSVKGPDEHPWESSTPTALANSLLGLATTGRGLVLDLDPPRGSGPARLAVGSQLRFRASSDRRAYLALFALSSDGTLTCLYPGPQGRTLEVAPGQSLVLPRPEDEQAGFELATTPPLGRDLIFLLASERPLPALPAGKVSPWVTEYPFVPGVADKPAARFARWVESLCRGNSAGVRLTVQAIDVVQAP
jgi:hypothetical protein